MQMTSPPRRIIGAAHASLAVLVVSHLFLLKGSAPAGRAGACRPAGKSWELVVVNLGASQGE